MQSILILLAQKTKLGLHLFLVVGIVFYLFTPLLEHWLGYENYARPHTHIHFVDEASSTIFGLSQFEHEEHFTEAEEHEAGFLCLLNINALFYVALNFNAPLTACTIQNSTLIFDLSLTYLQVSTIYLSSLDPPPRL